MTDEAYVKLRNSFIPIASEYADDLFGKEPQSESEKYAWGDKWNVAFHHRMDNLVKEELLKREISSLKEKVEQDKDILADLNGRLAVVQQQLNI